MAIEAIATPKPSARTVPSGPARRPAAPGPDRVTVVLFSVAAFLVVLALLATQLAGASSRQAARPALLVRKIYRTTVIETVTGATGHGGTSVSRSVSSSGASGGTMATPATRTSG
jgi:hypothetical protein